MVNPLYKAWLALRSSLFWVLFLLGILFAATLVVLCYFFSFEFRLRIVRGWIRYTLFLLSFICGLDYRVEGLENIGDSGFIVMSKHSSTWETIVLQSFFKPMVWVVKRELTWIPFFGWALKAMDPIALNRGTGRKAIQQLISESQRYMDKGRLLMLFPEGTRVPPGQTRPFKIGGAIVAVKTGYPVLPIAHNAGEFWPRHSWIKWPGKISIVIGKPISPEGKKPEQLIEEVADWINRECDKISDPEQLRRLGLV